MLTLTHFAHIDELFADNLSLAQLRQFLKSEQTLDALAEFERLITIAQVRSIVISAAAQESSATVVALVAEAQEPEEKKEQDDEQKCEGTHSGRPATYHIDDVPQELLKKWKEDSDKKNDLQRQTMLYFRMCITAVDAAIKKHGREGFNVKEIYAPKKQMRFFSFDELSSQEKSWSKASRKEDWLLLTQELVVKLQKDERGLILHSLREPSSQIRKLKFSSAKTLDEQFEALKNADFVNAEAASLNSICQHKSFQFVPTETLDLGFDVTQAENIPCRLGALAALLVNSQAAKFDSDLFRTCARIVDSVGNIVIPAPDKKIITNSVDTLHKLIVRPATIKATIGQTEDDDEERLVKTSSQKINHALTNMFDAGVRFLSAQHTYLAAIALDLKKAIEKNQDELEDGSHYARLQLRHVETMLAHAQDTRLFCYIILQLSTCLRNEELARLDQNFLVGDTDLNYATKSFPGPKSYLAVNQKSRSETFLSTKKAKKAKKKKSRSGIKNPPSSIVTRVLLKFLDFAPLETTKKTFFGGKSEMRAAIAEQGETGACQRSLRTTGATMHMVCRDELAGIRIEFLARMMSHKNTTMLLEVYANEMPDDYATEQTPQRYFALDATQYPSKFDGVDIRNVQDLWDSWLLLKLIERLKKMNHKELPNIRKYVADECIRLNSNKMQKTAS